MSWNTEVPEQETHPDMPTTQPVAHKQSFEHNDEGHMEVIPRPAGQDIHENIPQQDTPEYNIKGEGHVTTHSTSQDISNSLTTTSYPPEPLMQYILNMLRSWRPQPTFFKTWSKSGELIQTARLLSAEPPDTETAPKTPKGPRLSFYKQRGNSESSTSDWKSPTRWKPPRFITPRTFSRKKERGNAAAKMVISEPVLIHGTLNYPYPSQLIDIPQYDSKEALLHPSDALRTPSTTSSLIFPGREISEKEYKKRTLRPRENLESGFAERPADMEWKGVWDKWDEARGEVGRSSWHEEWQKDVKAVQVSQRREEKEKELERERRRAEKEKRYEERKVARQEKKEREERMLEGFEEEGVFGEVCV
jgi:hypothetical protein